MLAKSDEEDVDELTIIDWVTELAELISDGLETLTVDADWSIPLHRVAELCMEVVGAGIDVVLEELTESHPEFGGGSSITKNEIEDLGGDSHVDPLYDGEIILDPYLLVDRP